MGLTDSIYIKMNSRGKPLTEFEHFKAEFEKTIKNISEDLHKEISKKLDKDWIDLLWPYKDEQTMLTDDSFMRYFKFVSRVICFQQNIPYNSDTFYLIEKVYNQKENINIFKQYMDCWYRLAFLENGNDTDSNPIDVFFNKIFSKEEYVISKVVVYKNVNYFKDGCDKELDLNDLLVLFAVIQYLLNSDKISENEFVNRIRIVRNLVLNSGNEIRDERMSQLLNETIEVIINGKISESSLGYNENQKTEEQEKQKWLSINEQWKEELYMLEDHPLLLGAISIVGLEKPEYFKIFRILFVPQNYKLIRKVLLTIGDYSQILSGWRCQFGNGTAASWRDLLVRSPQNTKNILQILLEGILHNNNCHDYLNLCIDEYLKNEHTEKTWRYYFVKYPAMMQGESGNYYWYSGKETNPYEITMMHTRERLSGRHWDPFLCAIKELLNDKVDFENEYGAPLIVKSGGGKLLCKNDHWEFIKDDTINEYSVLQVNGIDKNDRIEQILSIINERTA
jgi:hypothetical protein